MWAAVLLSFFPLKAARAAAFNGPVGGDPLYKLRPIPTLDVGVRGALISSSDYQPPKHKSLSDGEQKREWFTAFNGRTTARRHTPILVLT